MAKNRKYGSSNINNTRIMQRIRHKKIVRNRIILILILILIFIVINTKGILAYLKSSTESENIFGLGTYRITFDSNTGTGTMDDQIVYKGITKKLNANTFAKVNYHFDGWNTEANGSGTSYADEQDIQPNGDITLYAKWEINPYEIINTYEIAFNANSGTGTMENQQMTYGTAANLNINTFTRDGYSFTGWNTEEDGSGTEYTDGEEVIDLASTDGEIINLYAQWSTDYLKVMNQISGDTGAAFDNTQGIKKSQVEKVYTLDTLDLPSDLQNSVENQWDVSEKQNGNIIAYALDTDSNSKYEIYLGQNGGVRANPDSTKLFDHYSDATYMDLSNLKTDDVTSMWLMFGSCSKLVTLDISNFDTRKVTSMGYMFENCSALTGLNVSTWNTSRVTSMSSMFEGCSALTDLNVSNWNTPELTSCYFMFNKCSKLKNIDLSNWDMSKVNSDGAMFQYCSSLKNIIMPNNYTRIDNFMFNHNSAYNQEKFTIPKSVEIVLKSHIFYDFGTTNFKKFEVEEGNTELKTIDDILYTYDGTRLINIPMGKTFENNRFELPEGITFLNELSFNRNKNIETLVIPNSYEIERFINRSNNIHGFINSGSSLNVAIYWFSSISKYEVKSDNPRYSSYEGCIYSKDGTELIAIPLKYSGILNIKEGTTTIGKEALWAGEASAINYATSFTTINIPASVATIDANQITTLNKLAKKGVTINIDSENTAYEISNNQIVAK